MEGNYVAMIVTLVVWIGIFVYVRRLDKRVKRLEGKQR